MATFEVGTIESLSLLKNDSKAKIEFRQGMFPGSATELWIVLRTPKGTFEFNVQCLLKDANKPDVLGIFEDYFGRIQDGYAQ